jgi:hypothetical protein
MTCDVITYVRSIIRIRILCLIISCNNKVTRILYNIFSSLHLIVFNMELLWIIHPLLSLLVGSRRTKNTIDLILTTDTSILCHSFIFTLITSWITENTTGLVHCGITASYGNLLIVASLEKILLTMLFEAEHCYLDYVVCSTVASLFLGSLQLMHVGDFRSLFNVGILLWIIASSGFSHRYDFYSFIEFVSLD